MNHSRRQQCRRCGHDGYGRLCRRCRNWVGREKQRSVLKLYLSGLSYRVIAALVNLSPHGVSYHLTQWQQRTRAFGKAALTRWAVDHGVFNVGGITRSV